MATPTWDETTPLNVTPAWDETTDLPAVGKTESAVRGAAQGASMGFADEITGALESVTSDKTYREARDESRKAYDEAKLANPKTYMAGEFGGAAATALVPGLGELTIPKMAAQGALYGLGASEADLTEGDIGGAAKDVAIGGTIGGIAGTAGKALGKVLPFAGKTVLKALGPSGEAVESRLASSMVKPVVETEEQALLKAGESQGKNIFQKTGEGVQSFFGKGAKNLQDIAPGPNAESEVLEGIATDLKQRIIQGSEAAQSHLNPNSYTTLREVAPIFDDLQNGLRTQGSLVGEEQTAASEALNDWFVTLHKLAKQNDGVISEPILGDFIRLIDKNIPNWNAPHANIIDSVQKQLRGALNKNLTVANKEYAKAMEPVSHLIELRNGLKKTFNLSNEFESTDATNVKMGTVLKESKTNAQELLKRLEDMYGHPFQENLKNFQLSGEFGAETPIKGLGLLGRASRMVGIDGGTVAKNIIDAYLGAKGSVENTTASKALQKFGPLLADAAKRGGNALASTHFVLATSNPEYQELVDQHQEP